MRQLVARLVSKRCDRRARPEPWSLFGSFGDDCFDEEEPPHHGRVAFCRRFTRSSDR